MIDDPIVNEVRDIRDKLARQFDYDTKAIFADLRERQKALGDRLVSVQSSKERKSGRSSTG